MEPGQQEQRRNGEEDQEPDLLVKGCRHVGDEDGTEHDDRADRPSVAEDGRRGELPVRPAQQPEDQQVVAGLAGHRQLSNGEVDHGVHDRRRRRRVLLGHRCLRIEDRTDHDRHDQRRGGCSDQVGDRPVPARSGPREPDDDAADGGPCQEVGPLPAPEDEAGIVERPRDGDGEHGDEDQADPALGWRPQQPGAGRGDHARHSASERPDVIAWTRSSYSASA